jgi:cyclase
LQRTDYGSAMSATYDRGLHEVGSNCYAYLQPDGGWGWSNAGLVVGNGVSLLVDTLFDLHLTAEMLAAMQGPTRGAAIGTLVNTHANGDHCYGNQLVHNAEIIASTASAHEMEEVPASMLHALNTAPGELGELFRSFFGAFDLAGIEATPPTRTFDGFLALDVGGRRVELHEVGPAHTRGDTVVFVPDCGVVYTGDILFHGGTPITWAGPLSNWVAAIDRIIALQPKQIVAGHGALASLDALRASRDYLAMVNAEARVRHAAGLDVLSAARDLLSAPCMDSYRAWGERGRIAVNVEAVYRELDPGRKPTDIPTLFAWMAQLEQAAA